MPVQALRTAVARHVELRSLRDGATAADAEAGVAILVRYLPPAKRSEAVREILNVLSSHAGESVPPEWLRQMRARYSKRRGKQR